MLTVRSKLKKDQNVNLQTACDKKKRGRIMSLVVYDTEQWIFRKTYYM